VLLEKLPQPKASLPLSGPVKKSLPCWLSRKRKRMPHQLRSSRNALSPSGLLLSGLLLSHAE
jgi:hypothetical protein